MKELLSADGYKIRGKIFRAEIVISHEEALALAKDRLLQSDGADDTEIVPLFELAKDQTLEALTKPATLRLHMGELNSEELRTAQAAVRFTLARTKPQLLLDAVRQALTPIAAMAPAYRDESEATAVPGASPRSEKGQLLVKDVLRAKHCVGLLDLHLKHL